MKKLSSFSLAAAALALVACKPAISADAPSIGAFNFSDNMYCAFLPEENAFKADDTTTWNFAFVTTPDGSGMPAAAPARMKIGDAEVTLQRDLAAKGSSDRTWIYRTEDATIEIELALERGGTEPGGSTGMPQTGELSVRKPARGLATKVVGGCGM